MQKSNVHDSDRTNPDTPETQPRTEDENNPPTFGEKVYFPPEVSEETANKQAEEARRYRLFQSWLNEQDKAEAAREPTPDEIHAQKEPIDRIKELEARLDQIEHTIMGGVSHDRAFSTIPPVPVRA